LLLPARDLQLGGKPATDEGHCKNVDEECPKAKPIPAAFGLHIAHGQRFLFKGLIKISLAASDERVSFIRWRAPITTIP
jgi:hypothetical protein